MDNQTALALTITALLTGIGLLLWVLFEDRINQYITSNKSEKSEGEK